MKLTQQVRVKNMLGLHTRPATCIVKLLQNCKSRVSFTYKRDTINAKSIMSILMLAAKQHSRIVISVEGEDAQEVMQQLVASFDGSFGEG